MNKSKTSIEERRKEFEQEIKHSGWEVKENYEKIKNYEIEDLIKIASNSRLPYNERFNSLNMLCSLVEEKKYIDDLLVLAIQGPQDASNSFKTLCQYGIQNILIQNGENK